MKHIKILLLSLYTLSMCALGLVPHASQAAPIDTVRGYIVLQVEQNGEAWYVNPATSLRHYLGRPDDAFRIMRKYSVGITNADLDKIPEVWEDWDASADWKNRVRGKILLQVEEHGEAWYVYPKTNKRYYLGRPDDAYRIMRKLGLGISDADLETIPTKASGLVPPSAAYSSYTINTERGTFAVKVITMPKNGVRIVTDTGNEADCGNNCGAKSLQDYMSEHSALAGMHGTYFCPPDYSACAGKTYTYNPPVYNTNAGVMINAGKLPFHSGPMIVTTTDRTVYYFHRTIDFGYSVSEFEQRTGKKIYSAIANYPSLMEGGNVIVNSEPIESAQRTKGTRAGIGYNDTSIFSVVASGADVIDLAYVFKSLGAKYAMNLDGGGSTAQFVNGGYTAGPGRLLPNAILFK